MKTSKFKIRNSKLLPRLFTFLIFNFALAPVTPAQIAAGGGFSLEKSAVAAGGGESAAGGFKVVGTTGQNAAGISTQNGNFSLIAGFWTADRLAPTAALVSISGKVTTSNGKGIRNVIVTLTDSAGNLRTTQTGSFGSYRFADIEVGQTYVLEVRAKKYTFSNPVRVLMVNDPLTGIDFTADN